MLKADSNHTTTASRNTPSSEIAVAASQPSLLNDSAGANEPAVNRSKKMTRRNAMAATAAATVSLALKPCLADTPRRTHSTTRASGPISAAAGPAPDAPDPIIVALDKYSAAMTETIAAHKPYAIAESKLPDGMSFGPSIRLRRSPERLARSHDDIEAYRLEVVDACERAAASSTVEYREKIIAANTAGFARMHQEFDQVRARYDAACRESGFDTAQARVVKSFDAEREALEEIADIQPKTLCGIAALQAFLDTMVAGGAEDDLDVLQAISRNLAAATAAIVDGPIPRVMPYRHHEKI